VTGSIDHGRASTPIAALREAWWVQLPRAMGTTDRLAPGDRIGDYVINSDRCDSYEATHVLLPRRARIDIMHATFIGLRPVAVRMMREACILEALRHPGVPRVFEVGVLADHRTQRPWVATELIDGVPLSAINQPLPAADVITILRDVADVLAHAHARGIAHRNLVTEAIVVVDERTWVTQWGDARIHEALDADRAFAADVHALAIVAQRMLAGEIPPRLAWLLEDMLVPNPMSRPIAAEVAARARLILDGLGRDDDAPIVEEQVVLVDVARPVQGRTKWTPPLGVASAPETARHAGIAIGVLKPRS
jgi:serine/threonine protein kinase